MIKRAENLFVTAYLLLIFGVYPLYMKQGYVDIGKAKYHFFIYCSLAALGILALTGVIYVGQILYQRLSLLGSNAQLRGRNKNYTCENIGMWGCVKRVFALNWDGMSVTDIFVMLYAVGIFISYVYSDYREEALWGTEGWYMGLALLLTLCGLYFFISRFWDGKKIVWYVGVAVSGITFLLGILDRFSVYLIPLEIRQPSFISTLGNINWFCGYFSVLAPIGICLFLFCEQKKAIFCIYAVLAFMAGFCQGGNSIFLIFGALFYILLWITIKKEEWIADYFLLLFLWGFSAQLVRIMRFMMPDGYNYETDGLCAYLTDSNLTLFIGAAAFGMYIYLRFIGKAQIDKKRESMIHRTMEGLLLGGIFCWVMLAGINTWAGIPGFEQTGGLLLNKEWGNGRGAAVYSSLQMYRQMPVFHKLFGVGPDCFSAYAYSLTEVAAGLRDYFGSNRLTNAHNELLTGLINTGIMGVCFFAGTFLSFIKSCMKGGEENPEFYLFVTCVACYFAHNMVSFAQVLNLPFLFLILGMGEAKRRMRNG